MPTGRAPTGSEKAQATRAALLELAEQLFAEQGYADTAVRDLARRGDVTSGAIYGHFRNKADLLVEAINNRMVVDLEASAVVGRPDTDQLAPAVEQLAAQYPTRATLRALILQGAAAARVDAEMRDRLRAEQLAHIDWWIEAYRDQQVREGLDPAVDMEAVVYLLWSIELGLGVLEALAIGPPSPEAWADLHRRLMESLAAT
jgi:TetR/AcrR family acrAB operon transcriptional repressor